MDLVNHAKDAYGANFLKQSEMNISFSALLYH